MRLLVLWLCLVLAFVSTAGVIPVSAAPQVAAPTPFPLTHEGHLGGDATIIKVAGQTGYLAEGNYFTILDVRNLSQIEQHASLRMEDTTNDIAIGTGIAYIGLKNAKIAVVAISDPRHPVLLGSFSVGEATFIDDLEVVGTLLYVGSVQRGLQIYDVSNPAAPLLKGQSTFPIGGPSVARDLAIVGTTLYAVSNSGGAPGVQVIDISNPAAPAMTRVIPKLRSDYVVYALTVSDGRLYVGESGGLRIFDLAMPTNPTLLASYSNIGVPDIVVVNHRAYITGSYRSRIIDVSTPGNIQDLGGHVLDAAYLPHTEVAGTKAFFAARNIGLQVVDVTNPAATQILSHTHVSGDIWDMDVVGNLAYVGTETGLQIVDISDPKHPRIRSVFGRDVLGVKVLGDRAYISTLPRDGALDRFYGLQVVDVHDPDHPVLLGQVATGFWRVDAVGTRVFVIGLDRVDVFDVSNPSAIQQIGETIHAQGANDIEIEGDLAYIAAGGGIVISNLNGIDLGGYGFEGECGGMSLDVVGKLIYVATNHCGLLILNLDEPIDEEHWGEVGRLPVPSNVHGVRVVGAVALVSDFDSDGAIYAVDISDPAHPTVRDRTRMPSWGNDLEVRSDRVFVAGPTNGLEIFKAPLHYAYLPFARQQ